MKKFQDIMTKGYRNRVGVGVGVGIIAHRMNVTQKNLNYSFNHFLHSKQINFANLRRSRRRRKAANEENKIHFHHG